MVDSVGTRKAIADHIKMINWYLQKPDCSTATFDSVKEDLKAILDKLQK